MFSVCRFKGVWGLLILILVLPAIGQANPLWNYDILADLYNVSYQYYDYETWVLSAQGYASTIGTPGGDRTIYGVPPDETGAFTLTAYFNRDGTMATPPGGSSLAVTGCFDAECSTWLTLLAGELTSITFAPAEYAYVTFSVTQSAPELSVVGGEGGLVTLWIPGLSGSEFPGPGSPLETIFGTADIGFGEVPEPATFVLLTGPAFLAWWRRRRSQ